MMYQTRINRLESAIMALTADKYTYDRDDNSNLHLEFSNERIQFPVIPLRPYQLEVQKKIFVDGIKRVLLSRPRRSGKEVESWNMIIQGAITKPGLYLMVYPTNVRARKILWEGAALIKGQSVPFLKMIPKRLVERVNNTDMTIKLKNGSVIWVVGSDIDPDKLRGTNPLGIVYSEFAFQDPKVFYNMLPVLRQNDGWLICQSTFDGMNHFYHMVQNNKDDPAWYVRVDSIETLVDENGKPYITLDMIEEDRRAGMPEFLIQQEYFGVVKTNEETKYFANSINNLYETNRIIPGLIIPNSNLYAAWDLGVNDLNCITLFQMDFKAGAPWPYIVGYIENNNKDLLYYIDECRRFARQYNLSIQTHFLPHDGAARKTLTINNETTATQIMQLGENVVIVPRPTDKRITIEAMRRMLFKSKFHKENTTRLIDCLSNYSKEYDEKKGSYKDRPKHDWASHGVDSYQTMTLAINNNLINERPFEVVYYS